jgi:hypothetical protein
MNKFVYFMAVGLAFTALQVAAVEASHDQVHVDDMRATEDSARQTMRATEDSARETMRATEDSTRQTMRGTEDNARQTRRDTEDNARQTRRDTEDRDRQAAEEAMNTAAGAGGHDCSHHPTEAARTACEAGGGAAIGTPGTDPCMGITPQAAQDACYASGPPPGTDPCMVHPTQAARDACYAQQGN